MHTKQTNTPTYETTINLHTKKKDNKVNPYAQTQSTCTKQKKDRMHAKQTSTCIRNNTINLHAKHNIPLYTKTHTHAEKNNRLHT